MNEPGPQFIKLYRGQTSRYDKESKKHINTSLENTDLDNIGIHWTTDKDIAENFAGPEGHVLTAYVHKRHVIDPNSSEGRSYAWRHNIWPKDKQYDEMHPTKKLHGKSEQEVTLRKGSPIHIFSMEFPFSEEGRVENFKAPLGGLIKD